MRKHKLWFSLIVSVLWAFFALVLLMLYNQSLMRTLPLGLRMVVNLVVRWSLAAVPLVFAIRERYRSFQKEKLGLQLLWGLGIGVGMSMICTLIPHLLGLGDYVGGHYGYTKLWQFAYELVYLVAGVALVEEFLFRGYFYHRLRLLFRSEWAAIWISSGLFGLFHWSGGILQVLVTGLLGLFWCLCRKKLRHCTLLSLILAHGLYDWLIVCWAHIFQ